MVLVNPNNRKIEAGNNWQFTPLAFQQPEPIDVNLKTLTVKFSDIQSALMKDVLISDPKYVAQYLKNQFVYYPNLEEFDLSDWYFIPENAFSSLKSSNFKKLKRIIVDDSKLLFIDKKAFYGTSLEAIKLKDSEYAGRNVLPVTLGTNNLLKDATETTWLSGLLSLLDLLGIDIFSKPAIGENAFSGTKLENITLPLFCNKIGDGAFSDITTLKEVYVDGNAAPARTIETGEAIFGGCTALETLKFTANSMLYGVNLAGAGSSVNDAFAELLGGFDLLGLLGINTEDIFALFNGQNMGKSIGLYFNEMPDSKAKLDLSAWYFMPAYTFDGVSGLSKAMADITMPAYLLSVGDGAFRGTDLSSYSLPVELGAAQLMMSTAGETINSILLRVLSSGYIPLDENLNNALSSLIKGLDINKLFPTIGKEAFAGTKLTHIRFPLFVHEIGEKAFAGSALKTVLAEGPATPAATAFADCSLEEYKFSAATLLYAIQFNDILNQLGALGSSIQLPDIDFERLAELLKALGSMTTLKSESTDINEATRLLQQLSALLASIEIKTPTVNSFVKAAYLSATKGTSFNFDEWFFIPNEAFREVDFKDFGGIPHFMPYCLSVGNRAFLNTEGYSDFSIPLLCVNVGEDAFARTDDKAASLKRLTVQGPVLKVGANAFGNAVKDVRLAGSMLVFDLPTYKETAQWLNNLTSIGQSLNAAYDKASTTILNALDFQVPNPLNLTALNGTTFTGLIQGITGFGVNHVTKLLFDKDNTAFGGPENDRPLIHIFEWMHVPTQAFKDCYADEIKLSPLCLRVGDRAFTEGVKQITVTAPTTIIWGDDPFNEKTIAKLAAFVSLKPQTIAASIYGKVPNAIVDVTEWLVVPSASFKGIETIKYAGVKPVGEIKQGSVLLNPFGVIIADNAFENCTALEGLDQPLFSKMKTRSFAKTALKDITIGEWDKYNATTFADNPALTLVYFDETVEFPHDELFTGVKEQIIQSITKLDGILTNHIETNQETAISKIMGELDFLNKIPVLGGIISNKIETELDKGFTAINDKLSESFTNLSGYVDENWIKTGHTTNGITTQAFSYIPSLTTADVHRWKNVPEIAFKDIETLQFMAGMPAVNGETGYLIGDSAFLNAIALEGVADDELARCIGIGEKAFYNCKALTLQDNALIRAAYIKDLAFAGTTALTEASIFNSTESFGDELFAGSGVNKIYMKDAYDYATASTLKNDMEPIIKPIIKPVYPAERTFAGADNLHTLYSEAPFLFALHKEDDEKIIELPEITRIIVTNTGVMDAKPLIDRVKLMPVAAQNGVTKADADLTGLVLVDVSEAYNELAVIYRDHDFKDSQGLHHMYLPEGALNGDAAMTLFDNEEGTQYLVYSPRNELSETIHRDQVAVQTRAASRTNYLWTLTVSKTVTAKITPDMGSMTLGYDDDDNDQSYLYTVTSEGSFLFPAGHELKVVVTPNAGCYLKSLNVNNVGVALINNTYILDKLEDDTTIICELGKTGSSGDNGGGSGGGNGGGGDDDISTGIDAVYDGLTKVITGDKTILVKPGQDIKQIRVMDLSGRVCAISESVSSYTSIPVNNAGIYIVWVVYPDQRTETFKVIVK